LLTKEDIVIALSGATTGKYGIYKLDEDALLNQRVGRFIFIEQSLINNLYVFYYLEIIRQSILKKAYGAAQPNISTSELEEFPLPLPPLAEQRRIVAKIEELFTKLDAGVEALKKAKEQIKRYRQAVLKHAFEGKLTEEWRKANRDRIEPASVLLEKIKEERKKQPGKKCKELPPIDTSELPELPESWVWVRLGDVSIVQGGYAFKSKDYKKEGIPLLRISNIKDNSISLNEETVFVDEKNKEFCKQFLLSKGDIVIALSGATTGKYGIYKLDNEAFLNQRVGRLIFSAQSLANNLYVFYYLEVIRQSIIKKAYGAAQPNISTSELEEFPLPLPPLHEQHRIVEEIERRLSIADATKKTIDQSLRQAERLRQSILKRAFEGKLVPQDPNDEPAEKLLERIREEKAKRESEKKVKKKGGR
jgi:type I restriction enzyme S subunit